MKKILKVEITKGITKLIKGYISLKVVGNNVVLKIKVHIDRMFYC